MPLPRMCATGWYWWPKASGYRAIQPSQTSGSLNRGKEDQQLSRLLKNKFVWGHQHSKLSAMSPVNLKCTPKTYDCDQLRRWLRCFRSFHNWNIIAFLESLRIWLFSFLKLFMCKWYESVKECFRRTLHTERTSKVKWWLKVYILQLLSVIHFGRFESTEAHQRLWETLFFIILIMFLLPVGFNSHYFY